MISLPSLSLEIALGVLLIAALIYSVRLDRKLHALRDGQSELAKIVSEFHQAASRAEAGVRALKLASEQAGKDLDTQVMRARTLSDELRILTEMGEARATRMTAHSTSPVTVTPSVAVAAPARASRPVAGPRLGLEGDDLFEDAARTPGGAGLVNTLRNMR